MILTCYDIDTSLITLFVILKFFKVPSRSYLILSFGVGPVSNTLIAAALEMINHWNCCCCSAAVHVRNNIWLYWQLMAAHGSMSGSHFLTCVDLDSLRCKIMMLAWETGRRYCSMTWQATQLPLLKLHARAKSQQAKL